MTDQDGPVAAQAPPARGVEAEGVSGEVVDAFVSLADSLVADFDATALLTQLAERAVHLLGITAAGILIADPRGRLRLAASSSESVARLELFQLSVDDGPCLECHATGAPVVATDAASVRRRWPRFAPAMRDQGLCGVVAVPLRLRQQTLGALGMFASTPGTPSPAATRVAQGLADIATIAMVQQRAASDSSLLAEQLQSALDSRVLVEQAKGVIAAQLGTSVGDAFQVLRTTARHRGVRLADLARALVEGRTHAQELDV